MEDLSLHILDIAENSIAANADTIEITISEDERKDSLSIEIKDNGMGMDEKKVKKALDPFYTTKTTRRFGLGLPLLSESAKAASGNLTIKSRPGEGTQIKADFQYSHIDRKPLGDMSQTILTLVMGNPEIDFVYTHNKNSQTYCLDTRKIKSQLNGRPLSSPEGIRILREDLKNIKMKLTGGKHEG
ncbi:MAG: ATP-binding protein [Candidatus Aminicenantes bacterium]|nr:ATP-binding protein [Candidatus Aminicenantes bacterium]MDH5706306.1 ATP-binding protein [Candidatus Aminicenantes bacterium]